MRLPAVPTLPAAPAPLDPIREAPRPGGSGVQRSDRRAALALLAGATLAAGGCTVPRVTTALWPSPLPQDRAAVLQALLRGQPDAPLAAPESPWRTGADPPASVELAGGGMRLTSHPGRRAWASPRLPVAPLGERHPQQIEELTWEATIEIAPGQRFFIACEVRFAGEPGALLIQPTPFDIQVTQDTERPNGGTSDSISALVAGGGVHFWRLRLDSQRVELRLDGSPVWSLDGARALARVAFGETRTDSLHGGTMLLRDVVYVRRPA